MRAGSPKRHLSTDLFLPGGQDQMECEKGREKAVEGAERDPETPIFCQL